MFVIERIPEPPWMRDALCREVGPDLFFDRATVHLARQVCMECPVRAECKDYGSSEAHGVWGGATVSERRSDRLKRNCLRGHRKPDGENICGICMEDFSSDEVEEGAA
jgi:hypothetical protein